MKIPPPAADAVSRFEGLIPANRDLQVRKVFGQPAAFVAGNMFFGVFGEQLFIRLSEKDRAEAEKIPGVRPFEPMQGRPMREYVVLPDCLLGDRRESERWVDRALQYAAGLAPKKKGKPPAH